MLKSAPIEALSLWNSQMSKTRLRFRKPPFYPACQATDDKGDLIGFTPIFIHHNAKLLHSAGDVRLTVAPLQTIRSVALQMWRLLSPRLSRLAPPPLESQMSIYTGIYVPTIAPHPSGEIVGGRNGGTVYREALARVTHTCQVLFTPVGCSPCPCPAPTIFDNSGLGGPS